MEICPFHNEVYIAVRTLDVEESKAHMITWLFDCSRYLCSYYMYIFKTRQRILNPCTMRPPVLYTWFNGDSSSTLL